MRCTAVPCPEDDTFVAASGDMSVFEAVGTLLAAAAQMIDVEAARRAGGPGSRRRLASILAAFLIFAMALLARGRVRSTEDRAVRTIRTGHGHLVHPPASWAAP
jgi:xanthine dehydrogenase molybdopterin-binding subunit B